MKRFEGKTALVTGGNSGIGLATALAFADEGARLVITGRDQPTLDYAKAQLGADAIAVRSDAGRIADAQALVERLKREAILLDAVFINAGIARLAPLEAVNEDIWDQSFNTNVKGPYFLIKALTARLNPGCAIVLNGSINAHIGMPNTSVYSASKAALISLAKTLTSELLNRGIRINVVSPGPTQTALYARLGVPPEELPKVAASIQAQIPLNRFAVPDEIAKAVLYLASPESAFVVGTELVIDGGMSQL